VKNRKILNVIGKIALSIVTLLIIIVIGLYGAMWILVNGPSEEARRLFVISVDETSAGGFLARLYLSESEIAAIKADNKTEISDDKTDASLIQLPSNTEDTADTPVTENIQNDPENTDDVPITPPEDDDGIEVLDVEGATYNGKLMIIKDPTRVFVGIPGPYGEGYSGLTVASMIQKYDAVAGTNAGGFDDPNGTGTGGIPDGIVIYEGELKWGDLNSSYSLAGIDKNGILTKKEYLAKNDTGEIK